MDDTLRTDLLPATLPLFWLALAALLATALWISLHVLFIRQARKPGFRFLCAFPPAAMAFWLLLQLAARLVFIASSWPLWGLALLSATACEATVWIYYHERMLCRPRLRRTFLLLRLAAVAAVCFMLVQPVLQRNVERRIRRRVVVLVDDSQSMHRTDTFWTPSEQLDMAQAIGEIPAAKRPLRLADATNQILRTRLAYWAERLAAPDSAETVARQDTLYEDAAAARTWSEDLGRALAALAVPDPLPQDLRPDFERLQAFQRLVTNQTASVFATLAGARPAVTKLPAEDHAPPRDVQADLEAARSALDTLHAELPDAHRAADRLLLATFDAAIQASISNACATSRIELARRILAGNPAADIPSLAERLGRRYDLEFYSFATSPLRIADPKTWLATPGAATTTNLTAALDAERAETDIANALETILQQIPSEERAGMLLLTDGRHTGDTGVDAVARLLGQAQTPASTILVGGTDAPFDFSVESVRARESVFLGDRVRVTAVLAATSASGAKTQVALLRDGKTVATREVEVQGVDWQEEIRLDDMPEERGTYRYELKIEADPREILSENNVWAMDVAVSDNRTHVLVADRRPRWEFRYLRNLFYGRDKSIHLQYFLSEPDTIRGLDPRKPVPPASASREFGDAEASALPTSLEEWRKFDVIILGDLDETVLDEQAVKSIRHCVETRGATLVCIAGPRGMPLAMRNPAFQAMLPIGAVAAMNAANRADEPFRVAMTAAGRSHEIMSLSTSQAENEALWNAQPLWRWRLPVDEVKPGAEILAVAAPEEPEADTTFTLDAEAATSPEAAVAAFSALRQEETRRALVVAQAYGMGKVLVMLTDQTWRLRYCVGDTHHHRFWGQIMRWAAGEQLRAGNVYARMGTDRIAYTPDEPVRIRARLADNAFTPLASLKPVAILVNEAGDETVRIELTHQEGSNGLYEGTIQQLLAPGPHRVKLDVPGLGGILGDNMPESLECVFSVLTARRPREAAHVTANDRVPRVLAAQSGGKALSPVEAGVLVEDFGEPSRTVVEKLEIPLWCTPWLFAVFLAALTAEWLLRKKGGLT